jgi:hypothetical protein
MHSDKKHFAQECTTCETSVVFEIIASHISLPREDPPIEYYLAKCGKCNAAGLFCREDYGSGFDADSFYRLYPAQRRQIRFILPSIVQSSYDEAVRCESARAWTALAVMVGRTLEAVATDYQSGLTLAASLRKMLDDGAISKELFEWSNQLRIIRNIGAHPTGEKINAEDATDALDFAQAILEILFDLRPRFEAIKSRRAKDTQSVKPDRKAPTPRDKVVD